MSQLIAIVDDDASFRDATTRFIRSLGYAVKAYASADEFLRSDCIKDAACLITDVQMPGMSGLELQGALLAKGSRLPVIFVAADPGSKACGQALAAGALAFLTKPFREEKLIAVLDQALSGRSA